MCECTSVRVQREGAALVLKKNTADWTPWAEFPSLDSSAEAESETPNGGHSPRPQGSPSFVR